MKSETPTYGSLVKSGSEHFNIDITDLGSLKLNVKWGKTLNKGTSNGGPMYYVLSHLAPEFKYEFNKS
jgi:hypothetical protein